MSGTVPVDTRSITSHTGRGLLGGTALIFLAEALILPTGFVTAVFLARRLGPADYGLFALASLVVLLVEWLCTTLFYGAAVKFVSEAGEAWAPVGATVLRLYLLAGVAAGAIFFLLAVPLARLCAEAAMVDYLRLFALDIPLTCLGSAYIAVLLGRGRYRQRAVASTCRIFGRLGLIVLFVELGLSVSGAIMGSIGASAIELLVGAFYARLRLFPAGSFPARKLAGFAAPLFLHALFLRLFRLDLFALKVLGATATQVGFYGAATNLSIPPSLLTAALSPPLLATLSSLMADGQSERAQELGHTAIRSVFWLLPFAAMSAGMSREITEFIYGAAFLPAAPLLALLIFAAVGLHAVSIANALVTASGRPGLTIVVTGPLVPLAFAGYFAAIPPWGATGAAFIVTAAACLAGIGSILLGCHIWGTPLPTADLLKSALCAGVAFALAAGWPTAGVAVAVKILVISAIIFGGFLLLRLFTAQERTLLRTLAASLFPVTHVRQ